MSKTPTQVPPSALPAAAEPIEAANRGGVEPADERGRVKAVQDWLSRRADSRLGRLTLQWFRAYFRASHNSGCAASIYSALSVLPAALVTIAYFHLSASDSNAMSDRLISHLKLDSTTAGIVRDTFGTASSNALAATITVAISFLLWGIGIGQIYQDVYARAWRIKVGSIADQGRFTVFFFVVTGAVALVVASAERLRETGWFVVLARLADRLDRVLALGAALPPPQEDRPPRAAARRAARLDRPRRCSRDLSVLPGSIAERERKGVRLVRRRPDRDRLGVHHDHDVAGLRGLLPGLGELASHRARTRRGGAAGRCRSGSRRPAMSPAPPTDEPEPMELPPPRRTLLRRATAWVERAHALRRSVEAARGVSPALDATFETIERDSRIGGGMLAGALSYRLFVFSLPLAFFIVSGFGLIGQALGVESNVVANSAGLGGTVTKQVESASSGGSNWWVALTSFLVLVYATRVLLRAVAVVHALAWDGSAASVKVSSRTLAIFAAAILGQLALVTGVGTVSRETAVGGVVALVVVTVRPGRALARRLPAAAPLERDLDRLDPRIAPLRGRHRRRADLQHPDPRPAAPVEVDHLRRTRDRRNPSPRLLPDRTRHRRSRRPQRNPPRTPLTRGAPGGDRVPSQ